MQQAMFAMGQGSHSAGSAHASLTPDAKPDEFGVLNHFSTLGGISADAKTANRGLPDATNKL